jgi:hypothetical protein
MARAPRARKGRGQDGLRDRDGDLWFGICHGISRLHPTAHGAVKNEPVRIASVRVMGEIQESRIGATYLYLWALRRHVVGALPTFCTNTRVR